MLIPVNLPLKLWMPREFCEPTMFVRSYRMSAPNFKL